MRREPPTSCSCRPTTRASVASSSVPFTSLMRAAMAAISACACERLTPGARRAATRRLCAVRPESSGKRSSGYQTSAPAGNEKPGGITPTMRARTP